MRNASVRNLVPTSKERLTGWCFMPNSLRKSTYVVRGSEVRILPFCREYTNERANASPCHLQRRPDGTHEANQSWQQRTPRENLVPPGYGKTLSADYTGPVETHLADDSGIQPVPDVREVLKTHSCELDQHLKGESRSKNDICYLLPLRRRLDQEQERQRVRGMVLFTLIPSRNEKCAPCVSLLCSK